MRFPRYQELFRGLSLQLKGLQRDSKELGPLHELQRQLIRAVLSVERRVLRLKRARHRLTRMKAKSRLPKDRAVAVKAITAAIDDRVDDLHQVMFLLRCFGDGIAFTYQSKYALKHLMFDEKYEAKQQPGFMTGKKGFAREYRVLCSGIRAGVPVLLADITNIIRHGDVCAMGGPDPVPIEVKSSRTKRARPQRQVSQLQALADFYEKDGADNFRGAPNVRRTELLVEEANFEGVMNNCIRQAMLNGTAMAEPETGLWYIAVQVERLEQGRETTVLDESLLPFLGKGRLVVHPTPDSTWWHMLPFTLTLDTGNMLAFIQREVLIFVVIDVMHAKELFRQAGVHAVALFDGTWAFQISRDAEDFSAGVFRIAEQHFLRVTHEFLSLRWFVEENAAFLSASLEKFFPHAESGTEGEVAGRFMVDEAQVAEWRSVRDVWDREDEATPLEEDGRERPEPTR
ncbi:hypothetical protein ACSFBI_22100 [Variovorax sp. RB3P1]|uniref:hypothetical protein n=1 Tax=Variovorax sp. RB3P1 TaxID=3443732 RepID=UPI003F449F38